MSIENVRSQLPLREHMNSVYSALSTDHTRPPEETQQLIEASLIPERYSYANDSEREAAKATVARAILEIGPQACRSLSDVEHWMACFYSQTVRVASEGAQKSVTDVSAMFASMASAIDNDPDPTVNKPAALEALGKWLTYAASFDDEAAAAHGLPKGANTLARRARDVAHKALKSAFSNSYASRRDAGLLGYDNLHSQLPEDHKPQRGLMYAAMAATYKSEKGYQAPIEYTHQKLTDKLRGFYQGESVDQKVSGEAMRYVINRTFELHSKDQHMIAEYVAFAKNYAVQALEILHDMPGINGDVRRYVRAALGELDKGKHAVKPNSDTTVKSHSLIAVAKGLSGALNKNSPESKAIQIGDTATYQTALHAAELLQSWACQQSAALPNVWPQTGQQKEHMQNMLTITQALTTNIAGNTLNVSLPALTREQIRPNYTELLVSKHLPKLQGLLEKWPHLIAITRKTPLELIEKVAAESQAPGSRHAAIAAYITLGSYEARQFDAGVKAVAAQGARGDKLFNAPSHIRYAVGLAPEIPAGADYTRPEQRLVLLANQWRQADAPVLDARNPADQLEAQKQLLIKTIERATIVDEKFLERKGGQEFSAEVVSHLQKLEEDRQRIIANQARAREARETQAKRVPRQERGTSGQRMPRPPGLSLGD